MSDEAQKEEREPWLSTILRMFVHAIGAGVFAFPLTQLEVVIAAAIGGAVGALGGRFLAHSRLRLPVALAIGSAAFAVVIGAHGLVVGSGAIARSLGPRDAFLLGEGILFGAGAACVSLALRALSIRVRALAAIEVAALGLSFAQLVVAHRHGAINRPFELADPILAQGGDPTVFFIAIGAAATAAIAFVLLRERNAGRALLHIVIAAAILLGVVGATQRYGVPSPPPTGQGLGLREDQQNQQQNDGQRRNNEELEFRDDYSSQGDRTPVALVLFHDDYSSPSGIYYFRQGAFSQFNGRRLVAATRPDVDRDLAERFPSSPLLIAEVPPTGAHRTTLETTVALLADHTRPFALEALVELRPERNPDASRFRRVYRAISAPLTSDYAALLGLPVGGATWTAEQRAHYTQAPTDPRYRELAQRIVDTELADIYKSDPIAQVLAITGYLGREGKYSLRSRHAGAEDPTGDFLFGDLTGYCVHFAHAAVYLLRSMGIPARVATGYAVDEASRQGGSALLVTGAASHAWPEVYVEGVGWVIVDVSPQTVLDPPSTAPDPDLQRLLAQFLRNEVPLPTDGRPAPPIVAWLITALITAGITLGIAIAMILFALIFTKVWRRFAPAMAPEHARPRVVYRAELDRLADLDVRRRYGESREAFAARIAAIAPSFAKLTAIHVAAKYGGSARGDAREVARQVQTEVRAAFPFTKRVLRALVPWSFLRAR